LLPTFTFTEHFPCVYPYYNVLPHWQVFSASFPREVIEKKEKEEQDKLTFKAASHRIRQSLLSLMQMHSAKKQSSSFTLPHLCSGTINGRGSFVLGGCSQKRQKRFDKQDCLERVLQNTDRLRSFYEYLQTKKCPELLELYVTTVPVRVLIRHILIFSSHRTSHTDHRTRTTRTLFLFFVLRQLVNRRIVPEFLLETL